MQIQVNTGGSVEGSEKLSAHIGSAVEIALDRFSERITRVEVHVSHQRGDQDGHDDNRCMMEARLEGHQPIAVTHQAATLDQAVDGAADRLESLLDSTLERWRDQSRGGRDEEFGADPHATLDPENGE